MGSPHIIVFDVETTGTDHRKDQVIELCVQFGLGDDAESRTWRFKPTVAMSPGAEAVHGISMEDLADCPPFSSMIERVRKIFEWAEILVGYNLGFDIEMVQAELRRAGEAPLDLRGKEIVDPFRLWQTQEPRSLQHAHKRFVGDSFESAHSASADVAATGRVLAGMLEAFGLADQDWTDIARVCEPERDRWIGSSKHLVWSEDGQVVVGFGKHSGTPVAELAKKDGGGYLRWILDKDFPSHMHEVCRKALELSGPALTEWVAEHYGPCPTEGGAAAAVPPASKNERAADAPRAADVPRAATA